MGIRATGVNVLNHISLLCISLNIPNTPNASSADRRDLQLYDHVDFGYAASEAGPVPDPESFHPF